MGEASLKGKTRHDPQEHVRMENLVFRKILGIPGQQIRDPWVSEELAALLKSYGIDMPLMIDSTDDSCQEAYEHDPDAGVPAGCEDFDVAPFAVQACEGKHVGDRCAVDFGKDVGSANWWRHKITSICLDLDRDGIAVCMPYENALCFNSWDYRPTHWYPDGYYCTAEKSGGHYSKEYVLGTCQSNPDYEKGCPHQHCGLKDCIGKVAYHDEGH